MIIKKEYDIKSMIEALEEEVKQSKKFNGVVKLDIYTAFCVLDVLQETLRREQEHQTLESAVTFVEKEDGTKINLLEENKQTCPFSCFGNYEEEDEWNGDCDECMYATECKKLYEQREKNNE